MPRLVLLPCLHSFPSDNIYGDKITVLSFLFSRLNSPSSLNLLPLQILNYLCGPIFDYFSSSILLLHQTTQNWMQYSRCRLTSNEERCWHCLSNASQETVGLFLQWNIAGPQPTCCPTRLTDPSWHSKAVFQSPLFTSSRSYFYLDGGLCISHWRTLLDFFFSTHFSHSSWPFRDKLRVARKLEWHQPIPSALMHATWKIPMSYVHSGFLNAPQCSPHPLRASRPHSRFSALTDLT